MTTDEERWHVEIKWLDAGGCEHVLRETCRLHDDARGFVAVAIDELVALDDVMMDGAPPPEPSPPVTLQSSQPVETLRDLWHWRISWEASPGTVTHLSQSWALTANQVWTDTSNAVEVLLDLREILRMTARRGPRALGVDA